MYRQVHDALLHWGERRRQRDAMARRLEATRHELELTRAELVQLEQAAAEEQRDLDKLEGLTLVALLARIRGEVDAKRQKEQQEALEARLRREEQAQLVAELEQQLAAQEAAIAKLGDVDAGYQQAFRDKLGTITAAGDENARMVAELADRLGETREQLRELHEAIRLGNRAQRELQAASVALDKAAGWGTFDMLGGGTLSTFVKHDHLADARHHVQAAKLALKQFDREVADVGQSAGVSLDIGPIAHMADYFLDGLIADWFVQSKIQNSRQAVDRTRMQLETILTSLATSFNRTEQTAEALTRQWTEAVEQA